jgi:hypothetical protein
MVIPIKVINMYKLEYAIICIGSIIGGSNYPNMKSNNALLEKQMRSS